MQPELHPRASYTGAGELSLQQNGYSVTRTCCSP